MSESLCLVFVEVCDYDCVIISVINDNSYQNFARMEEVKGLDLDMLWAKLRKTMKASVRGN